MLLRGIRLTTLENARQLLWSRPGTGFDSLDNSPATEATTNLRDLANYMHSAIVDGNLSPKLLLNRNKLMDSRILQKTYPAVHSCRRSHCAISSFILSAPAPGPQSKILSLPTDPAVGGLMGQSRWIGNFVYNSEYIGTCLVSTGEYGKSATII